MDKTDAELENVPQECKFTWMRACIGFSGQRTCICMLYLGSLQSANFAHSIFLTLLSQIELERVVNHDNEAPDCFGMKHSFLPVINLFL